jgi:CDGSH iron-sulfur domain-containing protein 3
MADATSEQPVCAQKAPYRIELMSTYRYAWCACGLSKYQPFCDGSHTMSRSGARPVIFTQDRDQTVFFCGCKRTGTPPYCDGTHSSL